MEIRSHRAYREDSAGSIMTKRFVAVPADWSVDQAIAEIRQRADVVKKLCAVYVVDDEQRLQGFVKLPNLLVLPKDARIGDHMKTDVVSVSADLDQEEVALLADEYELVTIPVLDASQRILGRITVDHLKHVIRDEAEENMMRMAGVSPDDSFLRIVKGRLPWLLTGLAGASLAAVTRRRHGPGRSARRDGTDAAASLLDRPGSGHRRLHHHRQRSHRRIGFLPHGEQRLLRLSCRGPLTAPRLEANAGAANHSLSGRWRGALRRGR